MKKPRVIIIDDNQAFLDLVCSFPGPDDLEIVPFDSAPSALEFIEHNRADLVISDVQMPEMSGVELFTTLQDLQPQLPVILITAFGSTQQAVEAVKQGAFHYFEKPLTDKWDLFWSTVREGLAKGFLSRKIASLEGEKSLRAAPSVPIIGRSRAIAKIIESIEEVADLDVTVLISGPTGTGKELVAQAIHDSGRRGENPFFPANCSAIAPGLLESELFGHEKGAFTGAIGTRKGLLEVAHRGTLFLDEISEASQAFQAALLRVIETGTFYRVGSSKPIASDFRILAATNRDLEAEIEKGNFRRDLYYRLNVYHIPIPPLRDRREDIPLIAEYYLNFFSKKHRFPVEAFSDNALVALTAYDWPGNVRELINVIERAVITCRESRITSRHLPSLFPVESFPDTYNLKEIEKLYIHLALDRAEHNNTLAAELLGISRKTLIQKLKLYNDD